MSLLDSLRPRPGLRVLVTAGGSGLGAAVARAFLEAGAHVHVCDIDRTALGRLAQEAPAITSSVADAAVAGDVDLVFDDVRGTLGGLDVLVHGAGIAGPTAAVESIDLAQWERTVAVNLTSHFLFARRAVQLFRQSSQDPAMVVMGSVAGRLGYGLRTPYAATRWALIGMVKSLAVELEPQGVRVNAILRMETGGQPAPHRAAAADDMAALALFLCSPAARNVTGQAVHVAARGCPEPGPAS